MPEKLLAACPLVRFLRDDPTAGLDLAHRIANQVKRPWTLEPADVVQDVYVTMLEIGDTLATDWQPPSGVSVNTVLACRTVFRLGGRDAYYEEWQWANRRVTPCKWQEQGLQDLPRRGVLNATPESFRAPPLGPATHDRDVLYAELLSLLPLDLRAAADLLFAGAGYLGVQKKLGIPNRIARSLPRRVAAELGRHGLWHPSLFPLKRKSRPVPE